MSDTIKNIFIAGVGGQGILLASEIVASAALASGLDVKQSEVHGMAQRGGSVTSHVRFGPKVYSPTIEPGTADVLISFELLEALRWIEYLAPAGVVVVNRHRINPMPVASGKMAYPPDVEKTLAQYSQKVYCIDAHSLALKAGHARAVNMVLLGTSSLVMNLNENLWRQVIAKRVPAKTLDINLKAYELGRGVR
jgi:indolepyruvate ferredoxin oxidoreductase, beta subunit